MTQGNHSQHKKKKKRTATIVFFGPKQFSILFLLEASEGDTFKSLEYYFNCFFPKVPRE
jgi:hypothetical protein